MSLKDRKSTREEREARMADVASKYTYTMDKESVDPNLTKEEQAWLDEHSKLSQRHSKAWEQHVVHYRKWALAKSAHGAASEEAVAAREKLDVAIVELADASKSLNIFLKNMPGVVAAKNK